MKKKPKRTTVPHRSRHPRRELLEIRMYCLTEAIRANRPGHTMEMAKKFETFITTGK